MPTGIELKGFDELASALQRAPDIAKPIIERAMANSLDVIEGRLKSEPDATEANRPGRWKEVKLKSGNRSLRPMGYYERHKGYWYPVMKKETLGEGRVLKSEGRMTARRARGLYDMAGTGGVAGYKLAKGKSGEPGTSEYLTQHWAREVKWNATAVIGVLKNSVSYAFPVEGPINGEPGKTQSKLMAKIGWPAMDTTIEASRGDIQAIFEKAVDDLKAALAQNAKRGGQ